VRGVACYKEVDSNGREIDPNLSTSVFKAVGVKGICQNGIKMRCHNALAQWLPKEYHETLFFYSKVNRRTCTLHSIGNADQIPVFYEMPSNVTVNKKFDKSVILRTRGNEKSWMSVMLSVLADGEETSSM
jgi:hypothetical protein